MSQQCNFSTRANGRHDVGGGTETAIEVSKLAKQMQSMQATMLSMQSFMTNQRRGTIPALSTGSHQNSKLTCLGREQYRMGTSGKSRVAPIFARIAFVTDYFRSEKHQLLFLGASEMPKYASIWRNGNILFVVRWRRAKSWRCSGEVKP
ncbi:hypothetical protein LWI29_002589 [Acer saccharum]|uniref:Uncharacterized protein n=1 Tax=Acer saccharum TaxID=4024 RepID=A0AA39TI38_ACESA|nr:hypothetical protein LWI29_002589 [Acer saccharum]